MRRGTRFLIVLTLLSGCQKQATYPDGCGKLPLNWITPRDGLGFGQILDVISVSSSGAIKWDGVNINEAALASRLKESQQLSPLPVTQIKFDRGVDCAEVTRLRQILSTSLDCSYGKCAEGSTHWWLKSDVGPKFEVYDPHPELTKTAQ